MVITDHVIVLLFNILSCPVPLLANVHRKTVSYSYIARKEQRHMAVHFRNLFQLVPYTFTHTL